MPKEDETAATGESSGPQVRSPVEEFMAQRAVLIAQIGKTKKFLSQKIGELTEFELEARMGLLETHYTNFNNVQSELEKQNPNEIHSSEREEYENVYCHLKSKLLTYLAKGKPKQSFDLSGLSSTLAPSQSHHHLPKLQLSKFSGVYTEWMDFIGMFTTLVHDNHQLSDIEKFQHLRSCLVGNAAKAIQSMEVTESNYEKALELLKSRYDNKRYIFNAHISKLFELQAIPNKAPAGNIRNMIDSMNVHIRALQSIGRNDQISDALLIHLLVSKLDPETQVAWEEKVTTKLDSKPLNTAVDKADSFVYPTWENLSRFLEKRCQTIDIIEANKRHSSNFANPHSSSSKFSKTGDKSRERHVPSNSAFMTSAKTSCSICGKEPHSAFVCPTFVNISPVARYKFAKQNNLCINCLKYNHRVQHCRSENKCQVCNESHHTLLHMGDNSPGVSQPPNRNAPSSRVAYADAKQPGNCKYQMSHIIPSSSETCIAGGPVILATALVKLRNHGGSINCRAILDSASQINIITNQIAHQLRVKKTRSSMVVTGIGSASTQSYFNCTFYLESIDGSFTTQIEAVVLNTITGYHPTSHINSEGWNLPANIKLADPQFYRPGTIDILIGTSLFFEIIANGKHSLGEGLPFLHNTLLGWIVAGCVASKSQRYNSLTVTTLEPLSQDECLDQLLERFWTIENPKCEIAPYSLEEKDCEDHFIRTTIRCPKTNKFIVRLPFRFPPSSLGESYDIAKRRFLALERKLERLPELKREYVKFINEYIDLQHMTPISPNSHQFPTLYIPHHCVVKAESSSTKIRVVFDGSCKTSTGSSLNDILKIGPTIQDDLFAIICRFRIHSYVLAADITKMYRQIWVNDSDAHLQCILWRNSPEEIIKSYRLNTVTYGTSCAPFLAIRCLRKIAEDNESIFRIGAKITLRDFYVDNLMTGADTIDELNQIKSEVSSLLLKGGFPLRKWATNHPDIIADIADEDKEPLFRMGDDDVMKTLGLSWSPPEDIFRFSYAESTATIQSSKRIVLSQIAKIFDPLGLINPIIVQAKLYIQELWKLKLDWDEQLPTNFQTNWTAFCKPLHAINNLRIPRQVKMPNSRVQLHAFGDASERAYGACIYVRSTNEQGKMFTHLLCAKSRIAPLKKISLPRLELCAALLASELVDRVMNCITMEVDHTFCWSDSTITLAWLAGEPYKWTTFVANRVTKIQQLTQNYSWLHVPSDLNPSDLVSRGVNPSDIIENKFWFEGPSFLKSPFTSWPKQFNHCNTSDLPEIRQHKSALIISAEFDIVESCKFVTNYSKLLKVFCYIRRFIHNTKKNKSTHISGQLSSQEMDESLLTIVQIVQTGKLSEEVRQITSKQPIANVAIRTLSPFLKDGILRVGGRLNNASLPYNLKHPILLPKSHIFTTTLIRHLHLQNLHAGGQMLICALRERFWVIGARSLIRQVIHNCLICFRSKPKIAQQIMADLPKDRVNPGRPFEITGIDYCGPILISTRIRGRQPDKAYIAVFVCFTTKATHLELVSNLTTQHFINALKRFVARRGKSIKIYSDNATNFVEN